VPILCARPFTSHDHVVPYAVEWSAGHSMDAAGRKFPPIASTGSGRFGLGSEAEASNDFEHPTIAPAKPCCATSQPSGSGNYQPSPVTPSSQVEGFHLPQHNTEGRK
jgi:hypothetical protein